MRRTVIASCTTITGLVLLVSWPTSSNRTASAAAIGAAGTGGASSSPGTSTTAAAVRAGTVAGAVRSALATPAPASTLPPSPAPAPAAAPAPAPLPAPAPAAPATATYDGATVTTPYGPVQVRITVTGGKVTAADAIQLPTGNGQDARINGYAAPILDQEAVTSQSAGIAMVSGATYTSGGYVTSLQSALDQAGR